MINLIKNELVKISKQRLIFVFAAMVATYFICEAISFRYFNFYSSFGDKYYNYQISELENRLTGLDPIKEEDVIEYVELKVQLETYKLLQSYDYESAQYYLIETEIEPLLNGLYNSQYIYKDNEQYEYYKESLDEYLKKIDNYDWKSALTLEKEEVLKNIKDLENSDSLTKTKVKNELNELKIKLECLNYRLDLEAPYSHSETSILIDDYELAAINYLNDNSDNSGDSRDNEKEYHLLKYQLEDYVNNPSKVVRENYIWEFKDFAIAIVVIGLIIISGSVISEEFNKGTIKQLLVRPFSRNKILLSKMISSFISLLLFALFLIIILSVACDIQFRDFGYLIGTVAVYSFKAKSVIEINSLLYVLLIFLFSLPLLIIILLVVILVGVISTNTVAVLLSGVAVYSSPNILTKCFSEKNKAFLPIYNWNLSDYLFGGVTSNNYASFGLAVLVCVITIILLLIVSLYLFSKKEVKNQ